MYARMPELNIATLGVRWLLPRLCLLLTGCGAVPIGPDQAAVGNAYEHWVHMPLPGKAQTLYHPMRDGAREALEVQVRSSASLMRRRVDMAPGDLGRFVSPGKCRLCCRRRIWRNATRPMPWCAWC